MLNECGEWESWRLGRAVACMQPAPVAMVEQVGVRQVAEFYVPRHENDEVAHYFLLSTATSQPLSSESRFLFRVLESLLLSVGYGLYASTSMFKSEFPDHFAFTLGCYVFLLCLV